MISFRRKPESVRDVALSVLESLGEYVINVTMEQFVGTVHMLCTIGDIKHEDSELTEILKDLFGNQ